MVENLLSGNIVYCEKCGTQIVVEDTLPKKQDSLLQAKMVLKDKLQAAKKKTIKFKDKVKAKVKDFLDKYERD